MAFKYKLPHALIQICQIFVIYQGVEFSEGLYNPEEGVWTEGDWVYSTRLS